MVSVACGDWPGLIGLQTLDLLYQMTNPVNVEVIVDKQLFYLRNATDEFLRGDLVARIRYRGVC
jgi:hypothetical protein